MNKKYANTDSDSFVAELRRRCMAAPKKLALPEITDPRVAEAAKLLLAEGSVREIHSPPLHTAGEWLLRGEVDAVLAGAVHTTAEVVRAAIKSVGMKEGNRTVSGAFILRRQNEMFLYADCAAVIEPTPTQLLDIASASVHTWQKLMHPVPPVVAFLSFSTQGSAIHASSIKMAEAAKAFKKLQPEVECDGEIQFDAAYDTEVGKKKYPTSNIPGRANCFVFPNLDAGNIAYKITQRLAGFSAYGPLLQGLAKPFSDLSRGATAEDIRVAAYLNLLLA